MSDKLRVHQHTVNYEGEALIGVFETDEGAERAAIQYHREMCDQGDGQVKGREPYWDGSDGYGFAVVSPYCIEWLDDDDPAQVYEQSEDFVVTCIVLGQSLPRFPHLQQDEEK